MRTKLTLATLLAVALAAPAALPCGAPFGNGINVDPRQDIVVVHKNGLETYVFQPRFCGTAQEFGLILPVPGKLSAQPTLSKAAVFTQLDEVSKPTIVYTTVCNSRSNGAGGGSAGSTGSARVDAGAPPTVVSSGTVGFMDYAQLEASSVDALTTWLDTNGYPYDSLAKAAFESYVTKGWLFVAFRVNQGAVPSGSTLCKDLGPIKLTFPTADPVVPTRMATARARDTTGALSYGPGFSWRVFGITVGDEQLGFGGGITSPTRTSNFSGSLTAGDVTQLDGLAVAGDRAVKLNLTFSYGSTDPDVALAKVAAKDYREVITQVSYVQCYDGGLVDSGPTPSDASVESIPDGANRDQGIEAHEPDATVAINPPESPGKGDAGVIVIADASAGGTADVRPVAHDDAGQTPTETLAKAHSGCSFSGAPGSGFATAFAAALVMGLLRRRRR